ncbi:MAG: hypothetical protein WD603_01500 [Patescibacteria group bacterium]
MDWLIFLISIPLLPVVFMPIAFVGGLLLVIFPGIPLKLLQETKLLKKKTGLEIIAFVAPIAALPLMALVVKVIYGLLDMQTGFLYAYAAYLVVAYTLFQVKQLPTEAHPMATMWGTFVGILITVWIIFLVP